MSSTNFYVPFEQLPSDYVVELITKFIPKNKEFSGFTNSLDSIELKIPLQSLTWDGGGSWDFYIDLHSDGKVFQSKNNNYILSNKELERLKCLFERQSLYHDYNPFPPKYNNQERHYLEFKVLIDPKNRENDTNNCLIELDFIPLYYMACGIISFANDKLNCEKEKYVFESLWEILDEMTNFHCSLFETNKQRAQEFITVDPKIYIPVAIRIKQVYYTCIKVLENLQGSKLI